MEEETKKHPPLPLEYTVAKNQRAVTSIPKLILSAIFLVIGFPMFAIGLVGCRFGEGSDNLKNPALAVCALAVGLLFCWLSDRINRPRPPRLKSD